MQFLQIKYIDSPIIDKMIKILDLYYTPAVIEFRDEDGFRFT